MSFQQHAVIGEGKGYNPRLRESSASTMRSSKKIGSFQEVCSPESKKGESPLISLKAIWPRVIIVGEYGQKLFGAYSVPDFLIGTPPPEFAIFDSARHLVEKCHAEILARSPHVAAQHAATPLQNGPERPADLVDYAVYDAWLQRSDIESLLNEHVVSSAADNFKANPFLPSDLVLAVAYLAEIIESGEEWISFVENPEIPKHFEHPACYPREIPVSITQRLGTVFLEAHNPISVPRVPFEGVQIMFRL